MDIVSLLFYRSWVHAVRSEASPMPNAPAAGERRLHHVVENGATPGWRALGPLAVILALLLAGALWPAGA